MALVDNYRSPGDADDTKAFSDALRDNALVELGEKTYFISNSIALTSAKRLVGRGAGISIISINNPFIPAITIASGAEKVTIENLTVTRPINLSGQANGDGIQCLGTSENVNLSGLELTQHNRGFLGRNTNGGGIKGVGALHNNSHGFEAVHNPNLSVPTPLQWSLTDCGALFNSGNGYYFHSETFTGPVTRYGGISVGTCTNLTTFANAGCGFRAEGNARVSLNGIRLFGGFFGEDGQEGIYIDGGPSGSGDLDKEYRGKNHIIAPNFVELSGLGYSGPYRDLSGTLNQSDPPSGQGDREHAAGRDLSIPITNLNGVGIKVINSRDIIIRPAIVNGAAWDGIFTYNVRGLSVQNAQVSNNGRNTSGTATGRRNGIYLYQCERQQVTGCRVFGQEVGIAWTTNDILITGNDFRDNTVATYSGPGATSLPNSACVGNLPGNV